VERQLRCCFDGHRSRRRRRRGHRFEAWLIGLLFSQSDSVLRQRTVGNGPQLRLAQWCRQIFSISDGCNWLHTDFVRVKRTSRLSGPKMSERPKRLISDVLLVAGLVASFLTHESGVLLHSVVSLIFTVFVLHHVKHNWRVYRRPPRRSKAVVNQATAVSMALATVTGLVFWWAGDKYSLGHGPISVVATVSVLPHVWVHRRALTRLARGSSAGWRTKTIS
jgi:hypothetical protein